MISLLLQCCQDTAPIVKCVHELETATSDNDVLIVGMTCCTIVLVAIIATCGLLLWKWLERRANRKASEQKRQWEEEDKDRKQKADLKDKMLNAIKDKNPQAYVDEIKSLLGIK